MSCKAVIVFIELLVLFAIHVRSEYEERSFAALGKIVDHFTLGLLHPRRHKHDDWRDDDFHHKHEGRRYGPRDEEPERPGHGRRPEFGGRGPDRDPDFGSRREEENENFRGRGQNRGRGPPRSEFGNRGPKPEIDLPPKPVQGGPNTAPAAVIPIVPAKPGTPGAVQQAGNIVIYYVNNGNDVKPKT